MSCSCGHCSPATPIPTGSVGPTGPAGTAATVVVPNTVYVSTSGSDSGSTIGLVQRLDRPFLTIAAAITAAVTLTPASTKRVNIVVFGGTFTENITIADSYITLMSAYESPLMYDDAGYATVISRFTTTKRPVHISGTITVTADFTNISGINCLTLAQNVTGTNCQFSHIVASTSITTNNTAPAGSYFDVHSDIFLSLPSTGTLAGYYEKCTGGSTSFAGNSSAACGNISGTLIDCVATTYSYASANANAAGTISGILESCKSTGAVCFASSNSSTGGTISGRLEDCITTAATSFSSSASATAGTISGKLLRCKSIGALQAFGYGTTGGTISGTLIDCFSDSGDSFGCFLTTGGTISGSFYNCHDTSSVKSFGSTLAGTGCTMSGYFQNCSAKTNGFGCATTGTAATLSARFENCVVHGGTASFGSSIGGTAGVISGTLTNCKGSGHGFCSSDTTGGTVSSAGQIINCTVIDDIMLRKAVVAGKIIGCRINNTNTNEPGIIVATTASGAGVAKISQCAIKSNGTATAIHATGAATATITFCRTFNGSGLVGGAGGTHANVVNTVLTPYNIDDYLDTF